MKSLSESPAILTVHAGSPGQYILRGRRDLVIAATKMLGDGGDARSFVIITSNDVKVFAVGDNGTAPTEVTDDAAQETGPLDAETQSAIDAEEAKTLPGSVDEGADPQPAGEPPVPARTRRRPKPASVAGHDEACARCSGTGKTKVILDGGAGAEATCPICRGEGVMKRYGARR